MDTLARFRLEAAKTRSCRLCNTTPRISHWIDGHSALATTSDAGCLSLLYWQAPFQRTRCQDPMPSDRSLESPVEMALRRATEQCCPIGYPCCNVHVPKSDLS